MRQVLGAAFGVLIFCAPAMAEFAGVPLQPCDNQPPLSAERPVDVPFSVYTVPGNAMFAACDKMTASLVIYGCTFPAGAGHPAIILLNGDESTAERACTLAYEKAHLPPNNWLDPAMEKRTPDAGTAKTLLVTLKQ